MMKIYMDSHGRRQNSMIRFWITILIRKSPRIMQKTRCHGEIVKAQTKSTRRILLLLFQVEKKLSVFGPQKVDDN